MNSQAIALLGACIFILLVFMLLIYLAVHYRNVPDTPSQFQNTSKDSQKVDRESVNYNGTPSVLYLLPIFFGVLGGVIAAVIAGTVYKASWVVLFIVGIISSIFSWILWVIWLHSLFRF